ncbi:hypothetical protein PIB30_038014 [Stylosanthes scabra]|uniref:Uncharacterized protein n=1 Tax=Stylosanthes scabra TaxID=79078 RepID=A0ABU6SEK5_9FABA|nr:hypothetical protein [Stylosanthes scabra]
MSCNNKDLNIKISSVLGIEPDANELSEIFFHANNVLRTDENPNLSFLEDYEIVAAFPNAPITNHDFLVHMADHAQEFNSWTKMNRYDEEFIIDIINFVNLCFR